MSENYTSPEQLPPPTPEPPHQMSVFERVRVGAGIATLAVGQVMVISTDSIGDVAAIDAIGLPIGLGLVLGVPEMRRRMSIGTRKVVSYLREPIGQHRQQG
jgi:hypothetical protein